MDARQPKIMRLNKAGFRVRTVNTVPCSKTYHSSYPAQHSSCVSLGNLWIEVICGLYATFQSSLYSGGLHEVPWKTLPPSAVHQPSSFSRGVRRRQPESILVAARYFPKIISGQMFRREVISINHGQPLVLSVGSNNPGSVVLGPKKFMLGGIDLALPLRRFP